MAAPASASASTIEPGHVVGAYKLTREIGKGSFAVVYQGKVQQSQLDDGGGASSSTASLRLTRVAIKIVTRKKLTAKLLDNLEGEISILRTVRHANIVELLDCLKTDTHIYLIMQFCRMGDLSNFIRSRRRTTGGAGQTPSKRDTSEVRRDAFEVEMERKYPTPHDGGLHGEVVRSFLAQLASAVQFMRGKNIVHRDIKPQNLLLQEPEQDLVATGHSIYIPQLKVADFGFARHLEEATLAETLCGSPLYMAPEILRYERYDAKADLWSIGAVLFEMCIGKPPYRAANHVELLRRIERAEDKIKFPDERSDDSLRREHARRVEEGKETEEFLRPHTVDDDIKGLIRQLLKQRPIERMGFEDFFACEVLTNYKQKLFLAAQLSSTQTSTASLVHGQVPIATRVAPAVPATAPFAGSTKALEKPEETEGRASTTEIPPASPAPVTSLVPQYFTPRYVVGGSKHSDRSTLHESIAVKKAVSTTSAQPMTAPVSVPQPADAHAEADVSSLEDNVLETPGSSVSHLPMAGQARSGTTPSTVSPNLTGRSRAHEGDDDRGYVLVDKKNAEAAEELARQSKVKPSQVAAWSPLGVVRRPSQQLSRLASLGTISPLAGFHAAAQTVRQTQTPTTPAVTAATADAASTTASSPPKTTTDRSNAKPDQSTASPSTLTRFGTTPPPNAPFAIPANARKPSFSRRTSTNSEGARLMAMQAPGSPRRGFAQLVPSSAPTALTSTSGAMIGPTSGFIPSAPLRSGVPFTPSEQPPSVLSRAISMASIRLFGVPTGMSMRGAGVRRSLRMGLGTGTLLSSSSSPLQTGEAAFQDVAEQNLLSLVHDYRQKSFVLSEFADARLGEHFAEGPHQNNYLDKRRVSSSSLSSTTGGGSIGRVPMTGRAPGAAGRTSVSPPNLSGSGASEQAAAEAYILYVRSLSFLQRAMNAVRDYREARLVSPSRYAASPSLTGSSSSPTTTASIAAEVQDAMQWLQAKFADGVERANFARARCSDPLPDSAQNIDKLVFDEALAIARRAAMEDLQNNRVEDTSATWNGERCLLLYETACTMLQVLLDPGEGEKDLSASASGTVEKFVLSISRRMQSIQCKVDPSTIMA